ncbi:hypothetical protein LINPERPRIM_LOCUS42721 [Linum perenne]
MRTPVDDEWGFKGELLSLSISSTFPIIGTREMKSPCSRKFLGRSGSKLSPKNSSYWDVTVLDMVSETLMTKRSWHRIYNSLSCIRFGDLCKLQSPFMGIRLRDVLVNTMKSPHNPLPKTRIIGM